MKLRNTRQKNKINYRKYNELSVQDKSILKTNKVKQSTLDNRRKIQYNKCLHKQQLPYKPIASSVVPSEWEKLATDMR